MSAKLRPNSKGMPAFRRSESGTGYSSRYRRSCAPCRRGSGIPNCRNRYRSIRNSSHSSRLRSTCYHRSSHGYSDCHGIDCRSPARQHSAYCSCPNGSRPPQRRTCGGLSHWCSNRAKYSRLLSNMPSPHHCSCNPSKRCSPYYQRACRPNPTSPRCFHYSPLLPPVSHFRRRLPPVPHLQEGRHPPLVLLQGQPQPPPDAPP